MHQMVVILNMNCEGGKIKQMKYFLFYDEIAREEFIVEANRKGEAIFCAHLYYPRPSYNGEISFLDVKKWDVKHIRKEK